VTRYDDDNTLGMQINTEHLDDTVIQVRTLRMVEQHHISYPVRFSAGAPWLLAFLVIFLSPSREMPV